MKKQWMNRILKPFFCAAVIAVLFSGLAACHKEPAYIENPIVRNLTNTERKLLGEIEASGIQVIKEGMVFTFVIPTDCFFVKQTRALKSHREKDLDWLAQFIYRYSMYFARPTVTITGHTDKTWLSPARDVLSMHYAEVVAAYFREDGIDPNIMTVNGKGAEHPIASNRYPMGTAFNRRVVITIR
ncbi:MAG: hypothetical protein A3F13_02945 [Gammaproteobacteria bacterium RIFCSPHIGHO2_12_FULL_40_19]|nr:MAG: hypothetical protein A3F13_02945 [Gammaproteobacteria bacterium RIFCSPHIGHO2_12_FULL_40_19]